MVPPNRLRHAHHQVQEGGGHAYPGQAVVTVPSAQSQKAGDTLGDTAQMLKGRVYAMSGFVWLLIFWEPLNVRGEFGHSLPADSLHELWC